MRAITGAVGLVAMLVFSGCDQSAVPRTVYPSPTSPTSVTPPAVPPPSANAVLEFSSLAVAFNSDASGVKADYVLKETGGKSAATLESLIFETGGLTDVVDAWCLGDAGIKIAPSGSLDSKTLGYCQSSILTRSPGEIASLTAGYKQDDGRRETVRMSVRVTRAQ